MQVSKATAGDLKAGVFTVINLSPIDVGYGLLLASAFGFAYAEQGIAAAFLSLLVGNLLLALTRRSGLLFSGTRPAQTLIVAEMLVRLLSGSEALPPFSVVFAYIAVCTMLAGTLELVFGLLRAGSLIKHFPVPVLTGYINAVALLMVWPAAMMILGLNRDTAPADVLGEASLATLARALFALVLLVLMARISGWSARIHWSIAGLFGGIAAFHLVSFVVPVDLGKTLPPMGAVLPSWDAISTFLHLDLPASPGTMVRQVLPYSLAIAVMSSIESLLASARYEELSGQRADANRILIDQGIANLCCGVVGGLPCAPSISRLSIGHELDGRGYRSLGIAAVSTVILMTVGGHALSLVPVPVVGALMAFLAWTMIDPWTHGQVRKLFQRGGVEKSLRRQVRTNMTVMLAVIGVAFSGHLVAAMFAGAVLSMFLFVRDHSKSVIGRHYSGQHRHSVVMRSEDETRFLAQHGTAVLIQELNAPIVFGTADRLFDYLAGMPGTIRFLILDFQQVREIDDKGARILARLARGFGERGVALHIAGLHPAGPRGSVLRDAGLATILSLDRWHANIDMALEQVENQLLANAELSPSERKDLDDLDVLSGFNPDDLTVLHQHLDKESFRTGQKVFAAGDMGDRFYIVAMGRIEIHLALDARGATKRRIAGFAPGVVFGEMALFSRSPRSADAVAACESTVWSLAAESLHTLQTDHPQIACKLLANIIRQVSARLIVTNDELVYATVPQDGAVASLSIEDQEASRA